MQNNKKLLALFLVLLLTAQKRWLIEHIFKTGIIDHWFCLPIDLNESCA
jgi:hypothetical protein